MMLFISFSYSLIYESRRSETVRIFENTEQRWCSQTEITVIHYLFCVFILASLSPISDLSTKTQKPCIQTFRSERITVW